MNDVQLRVGDLLYAMAKRWKMIAAFGFIGLVCGFALSGVFYLQGNYNSYQINCSVAITSQSATGAFTGNSSYLNPNDFYLAEDLVDASTFVMQSNRVLQTAIDAAGLVNVTPKEVSRKLDINRYNETQVLEISLSWNNSDAGIRLMNALLDTCKEVLPETLMVGSVAVIDEPTAKYLLGGGGYSSLWLIFGVLGALAGAGVSALEVILRPTLLNLKDVEDVLGLETFGIVPRDDAYFQKDGRIISEKTADTGAIQNFAAAAYILSNRMGKKEKQHRFYVTSAEDGEGKSTVAANLALQLSDMEKRTLLLDLNTRAPGLAGLFLHDTDYSRTLNALYKGESSAQEAVISLTGHLDLLPLILEHNAVPLDGTLFELLEKIMEPYEYVIIDASSVGQSPEVLRLNQLASNVLFVVRYDSTPMPTVLDAIEKLDKSGVRVLGCVVNGAESIGTLRFRAEKTSPAQPRAKCSPDASDAPLPEELFAAPEKKAPDKENWRPTGGDRSVMDELTDDLKRGHEGMSDDEAIWELMRMGTDGSWKKSDPNEETKYDGTIPEQQPVEPQAATEGPERDVRAAEPTAEPAAEPEKRRAPERHGKQSGFRFGGKRPRH